VNKRLMLLLMVLLALASLRFAWWTHEQEAQVVQAVTPPVGPRHASATSLAAAPTNGPAQHSVGPTVIKLPGEDTQDTRVPNIFVGRTVKPPSPPAIPTQRQVPTFAPTVAAPVAPPSPPMPAETPPPSVPPVPFQVIGGWRDAEDARVFLAGPTGTLQARVGDVILGYQLREIAPQKITLVHLSTQRQVVVDVSTIGQPFAANRTTTGKP
jgi:hypothetical protein